LPEDRRRRSLSRFPLIDNGFAGGANAPGEAVLREAELATKAAEALIVVGRNRRQGRRARLLPAESAVVRDHELLRGGARDQPSRPAEHRLHGEVRFESAGPDGSLQRTDMNAEFLGQLDERQ
jgi:hypothetical protein